MRPALVGASIAGAFLMVIVAAQLLGAWQTIHGRDRGMSIWDTSGMGEKMVTGSMTLSGVSEMYQVDEPELRVLLEIRPNIAMNTPINELRQKNPDSIPSPEEIEGLLVGRRPGTVSGASTSGSRQASEGGNGRGSRQSARPRGGGGGRATSGSLQQLRGSTTLQEALKLSGKTLEQVKADWNLSFVDPQTNLGALARMIGIPMRDLRDYFQR
jgi:hypothetical protein